MFRNLLIVIALFGLGWGASFGAGVAFGRRTAPATAQAATIAGGAQVQGGAAAGQAAGGQFAQFGGQGGQGARVALGTVERLDGQTLILSGQNNQQTRVALNAQTQILKQAAGSTADLTPGASVTVQAQGQPAADGTITAATVMIGGPAGGGALIQRPGGAGAQGAGQQGAQQGGR